MPFTYPDALEIESRCVVSTTPLEEISELSQHDCQWVGRLPAFATQEFCSSCQRQCSAGDVVRCRLHGIPEPAKVVDIPPPPPNFVPTVKRVKVDSGIGDCLKRKFEAYHLKQKPGCSCKSSQAALNSATPEQVEQTIDSYVNVIFENVASLGGIMGAVVQAFSWVSPESAKSRIKELLRECLTEVRQAPPNAPESPTEPLDSKDGSGPTSENASP